MKIGVILIATNSYIVLSIKFVKRFMYFYTGNAKITFYIFTDKDPHEYLPDDVNIVFIETHHRNWVEGTDSKFSSIISIEDKLVNEDFCIYVDSDTSVNKHFNEEWFIGESVGGQHYDDLGRMIREGRPFDRNPRSKAYIPRDSKLPQMYYYGAFFAFSSKKMIEFCKLLRSYQLEDKKWGYEPAVNDESYINREFHFNPPSKIVLIKDFKFAISDKSGIGDPRNPRLDVSNILTQLKEHKNDLIDIRGQTIICKEWKKN